MDLLIYHFGTWPDFVGGSGRRATFGTFSWDHAPLLLTIEALGCDNNEARVHTLIVIRPGSSFLSCALTRSGFIYFILMDYQRQRCQREWSLGLS